jgi:hypothetical protein
MFSIRIPDRILAKLITESSDGSMGAILMGSDTLFFSFGYDIDNLAEKDPAVIYYPYNQDSLRKSLDTPLIEPGKIVYTPKINFDIDEFRKQNVIFETISGHRAKITAPRVIGNGGITGVYVDSLVKDNGGRLKFSLYAKNLDSAQNQILIKSMNSIVFFNYKAHQ